MPIFAPFLQNMIDDFRIAPHLRCVFKQQNTGKTRNTQSTNELRRRREHMAYALNCAWL